MNPNETLTRNADKDPFEEDLRRSFRAHASGLEPMIPPTPQSLPAEIGSGVEPVRPVRGDRDAGALRRGRLSFAPGLAIAAVVVLGVGIALLPAALHTPAPNGSGTPVASLAPVGYPWPSPVLNSSPLAVAGGAKGWIAATLGKDAGVYYIAFSPTGEAWTTGGGGPDPVAFALAGAFATQDRFVLYGRDTSGSTAMFSSPDGIGWQPVALDPSLGNIGDVVSGGAGFVSLGRTARRSRDLASWSGAVQVYAGADEAPGSLSGSSRGYLAGLSGTDENGRYGMLAWSPDGESWAAAKVTYAGRFGNVESTGIGRDGMVAVGPAGGDPDPAATSGAASAAWVSTDGAHWKEAPAVAAYGFVRVVSDGTYIYGASRDGLVLRSTDGVHWDQIALARSDGAPAHGFTVAAVGPLGLAITGLGDTGLWVLPAAALEHTIPAPAPEPTRTPAPTPVPTPGPTAPSDAWQALSWPPEPFGGPAGSGQVAAGPKGVVRLARQAIATPQVTIYYSHGAGPMQEADTSDPSFVDAVMSAPVAVPAGFVAFGQSHTRTDAAKYAVIWYSADGSKWVAATASGELGNATVRSVAASPSGLLAVGGVDGAPAAWISADGTSWKRVALDDTLFSKATLYSAAWWPRAGWVVGGEGTGPTIWTSLELPNWHRAVLDLPEGGHVNEIHVARDGILAIGTSGQVPAAPATPSWTSQDGLTWSAPKFTPVNVGWTAIASDGVRVIRQTGTSFEHSFDGATWSPLRYEARDGVQLAAVTEDGVLAFTGPFDQLWSLGPGITPIPLRTPTPTGTPMARGTNACGAAPVISPYFYWETCGLPVSLAWDQGPSVPPGSTVTFAATGIGATNCTASLHLTDGRTFEFSSQPIRNGGGVSLTVTLPADAANGVQRYDVTCTGAGAIYRGHGTLVVRAP